jgi:hypothetical protein
MPDLSSSPIRSELPIVPRGTALVEADGIEPTTPCLQSRCSPTELRPQPRRCNSHRAKARAVLVGPGRFELPTSRLSSARSNQLSYEPGSFEASLVSRPVLLERPRPTARGSQFRIGKGCAGGGMASNAADPKIRFIPGTDQVMCRLALGSFTLGPVSLVALQTA